MKTLLIAALAALPVLCASQDLTFSEVIHTDSTDTADELFVRARSWFVDVFENPDKVLQVQDKTAGELIGKGTVPYKQSNFMWGGSATTEGNISFIVRIQVKPGRYRYEITGFSHLPYQGGGFGILTEDEDYLGPLRFSTKGYRNKVWNDLKRRAEQTATALTKSLIVSMEKGKSAVETW